MNERSERTRRHGRSDGGARRGSAPAGERRPHRPGRRAAVGLVVSVALVGFLLVGVFPTRDWLAQRDQTATQRAELDALEDDQRRLEQRIARLQTPEEVERIAREEYGMTRPGERPFRILPPAVAPVELPDTWPFVGAEDWLNR